MRKLFSALLIFLCVSSFAQTTNFTFNQMSSASAVLGGGQGISYRNNTQWDNSGAPTVPNGNTVGYDHYVRLAWLKFESSTTAGSYTFSTLDTWVHLAIDNGQKLALGIMPMCQSCGFGQTAGGTELSYPTYLHNLMQSEGSNSQDWVSSSGGTWVPNWNSPNYLARHAALLNAIANYINTATYKGKNYRDAISYIDIRGYGNFGEWHNSPWSDQQPSGRVATSATLKTIVDQYVSAFPNFPLVAMTDGFDQGDAAMTPLDVTYYLLTKTNNWGSFGWRRDNWGQSIRDPQLQKNSSSYNGVAFAPLIMSAYQRNYVTGEPNQGGTATGGPVDYYDLPREVQLYHVSLLENGNYSTISAQATKDSIRRAGLLCGYRLVMNGGNMTTTLQPNTSFNVSLNWRNVGIAPTYENWNVTYELRNSSDAVVQTFTSSFKPKLFLPASSDNVVSESFTLGNVPAGTNYKLVCKVVDASGYRLPMTLGSMGRDATGAYPLRTGITVSSSSGAPAPVANAGANQTITLPISIVTLNGGNSTGTINSYAWTKVSGPNTPTISIPTGATTTVIGLIQGTYVFQLSLNGGASTSQVTVSVNGAVSTPAVANAGSNQSITLPVSSVTLNGSGSTGTINSYAWTKVSGPNTPSIASSGAASTTVSGLIQGTYVFQLSLNGGTSTSQVTVTVNGAVSTPAPVANAGSNQTITLPVSSVTLNGSGSTGTINSYAWTKVSGPNTPGFASPDAATTTVSGLTNGTYVFQLSLNGGASTSQVTVTVNAAQSTPTVVANAGTSQTITLPATSTTLDGSKSTGAITSYAWTRLSGPSYPSISNTSAVTTSVRRLVQGTYVFQLSVNGGASTSQVTVNVVAYTPPATTPPAGDITIFTTQAPPTVSLNDATALELGVKFRSSTPGYIVGVRFYKVSGDRGTHTGELYSSAGTRLAQAVFTSETSSGWQTVMFSTPVAIVANTTYVAAYHSASGDYPDTDNYFGTAVVNGPLTALADGTDGKNGVYSYTSTPAFPKDSYQKSNYWVDAIFNTSNVAGTSVTARTATAEASTDELAQQSTITGKLNNNLAQNYPNPVSGSQSTIINYTIGTAGKVEMVLYDVLGVQVKVMINETKQPGTYSYSLDTKNLRKGTYFYKIRTGNFTAAKTIIVQ